MASPPSLPSPRSGDAAPNGHRRVRLPHPRGGQRKSPSAAVRPPDVATAAAQAVVRYLNESSVAVLERQDSRPAGADQAATATAATTTTAGDQAREADVSAAAAVAAMPWSVAAEASQLNAESVAVKAAAVSVAALDRIEAMAAKLEADIAVAHRAQAEIQAGAGAAAEAAVRAAQAAWRSARAAAESDKQAKISLVKVARYVEVTVVLLVIAMIIFVVVATSAYLARARLEIRSWRLFRIRTDCAVRQACMHRAVHVLAPRAGITGDFPCIYNIQFKQNYYGGGSNYANRPERTGNRINWTSCHPLAGLIILIRRNATGVC